MAHQHDDERIPLSEVAELIPSQESPEWPRLLAGLESSERARQRRRALSQLTALGYEVELREVAA